MIRILLALALSLVRASDIYYEGDGTAYTLGSISSGNCNFMHSGYPLAATNYVAINHPQWDEQLSCGRCIQVSCADSRCKDQSHTEILQVLDRCPECKHGDLDMSPSIFKTLTGSDPSRYKIKWKFIECPIDDGIYWCLHKGSSQQWTSIQPTGFSTGIKSITINDQSTQMMFGAFYFITTVANLDLNKVKIRITDKNNYFMEDTVALRAGQCTPSTYVCD